MTKKMKKAKGSSFSAIMDESSKPMMKPMMPGMPMTKKRKGKGRKK
ncbi:MAG: hypothetical protein NUV80_04625 [Candidatus Berkelbacteria bacterium]|nr:hypothetical protein [Candidatus Berkelbacteria bacterium]